MYIQSYRSVRKIEGDLNLIYSISVNNGPKGFDADLSSPYWCAILEVSSDWCGLKLGFLVIEYTNFLVKYVYNG